MKILTGRRLRSGLAILALVTLMVAGTATPTPAQGASHGRSAVCTFENVAGSYAYSAFGTLHPGNALGAPAGAYTSVAVLVLDNEGNWSVPTARTSYNGTIVDEGGIYSGSYTLGDDCSITIFVGETPYVFAVFVNNRKELRGMSLLQGTNVNYTTTTEQ
jgi:hypothetical protein